MESLAVKDHQVSYQGAMITTEARRKEIESVLNVMFVTGPSSRIKPVDEQLVQMEEFSALNNDILKTFSDAKEEDTAITHYIAFFDIISSSYEIFLNKAEDPLDTLELCDSRQSHVLKLNLALTIKFYYDLPKITSNNTGTTSNIEGI